MRSWEVAFQLKRRTFYEPETDTIRSCPENYCLAQRGENGWRVFRRELATLEYHSEIQTLLDKWQNGSTAQALASVLASVLPVEAMTITTDQLTHIFIDGSSQQAIDFQHPITLRSLTYGETLEQIRIRYPDAVLVSFDAWQADKAASQDSLVTWDPSTEEQWLYAVDVLPPALLAGGFVAVGEPSDHHAMSGAPRFAVYWKRGETYLAASRPMTLKEVRAILNTSYAGAQS